MTFNPSTDIPDLSGKIIVVTGGSSGLGKETVHQLAKHNPQHIYLAARTAKRGDAAIKDIVDDVPAMKGKISFLEMDLASFTSLRKAANKINDVERLDILINNAGLMAVPEGLTEDGYEVQFGSNYMGTALFTELLLPKLLATARTGADVRVVNLSSELFRQAPKGGILFDKLNTTLPDISSLARYGQSKLADFYHTHSLAERFDSIKFVAIHPGVVNTGLFDDLQRRRPYVGAVIAFLGGLLLSDVHQGARAQLWAATGHSDEIESGGFYRPSHKRYTDAILKNRKLAEALEKWTHQEFIAKGFETVQS